MEEAALKKLSNVDVKFHQIIYDACGNKQLKEIIEGFVNKMIMYWFQVGFSAIDFQSQFEELEELYHALKEKNPKYYEKRLSSYRKKIRDDITTFGNSLDVLHDSSQATLDRLKSMNVGLIILDECHHLMGHWGRVLADAKDLLGDPHVIGLTATPPDRSGKRPEDIDRYDEFFGEIDFEVPVPAVQEIGDCFNYLSRGGPDDPGRSCSYTFRPFGRVSPDQNRFAQVECFFLDSAGIGQNHLGIRQKAKEIEIAEGIRHVKVWFQAAQILLDRVGGSGVNWKYDRQLAVQAAQYFKEPTQLIRRIDVARAV